MTHVVFWSPFTAYQVFWSLVGPLRERLHDDGALYGVFLFFGMVKESIWGGSHMYSFLLKVELKWL